MPTLERSTDLFTGPGSENLCSDLFVCSLIHPMRLLQNIIVSSLSTDYLSQTDQPAHKYSKSSMHMIHLLTNLPTLSSMILSGNCLPPTQQGLMSSSSSPLPSFFIVLCFVALDESGTHSNPMLQSPNAGITNLSYPRRPDGSPHTPFRASPLRSVCWIEPGAFCTINKHSTMKPQSRSLTTQIQV